MRTRQRLLIAFLLTANLVLIVFVFARSSRSGVAKWEPPPPNTVRSLPLVELRDDRGRILNSSRFIGFPLFVQFVNPHVDQQTEAINTILSHPPHSSTSFLLITNDATQLRKRLQGRSEDVVVVEDLGYQLRDAFEVPRCCEKWVLFDADGKVVRVGAYDAGDALSELLSVTDRSPAYSPQMLLAVFRRLNEGGTLGRIYSANSRSGAHTTIVAMFSSVCTGCPTGTLVDLLNSHAKLDTGISYLALVPNTFNKIDAQNLKVNLGLCFPVELANSQLSREWLSLNQQYGERSLNGSVIAVKDRKIISVVNGIEETRVLLNNIGKR